MHYKQHLDQIPNITFIVSEDHYTHLAEQYFDNILLNYKEGLSETIINKLTNIVISVQLKLYITNQCPHCSGVIRSLIPLAAACRNIHLKIIDGTIETEQATADKIMSVPSLILDNGFRWIGAINQEELVDIIVNISINKETSGLCSDNLHFDKLSSLNNLTTSSLKMILEDGRAGWIAEQMLLYSTIFPNFIGLITHKIWSVRLGAMVVIEEIVEKSPELAITIAPELLNNFTKSDIPTQGDILYALGEIGDIAIKEEIIKLINITITHPEVMEAAQAAIESIELRYDPHKNSNCK